MLRCQQGNGGLGGFRPQASPHRHTQGGIPPNALCRRLNPVQLLFRQTPVPGQGSVGQGGILLHRQQIRQGDLAPYIGNIHLDHIRNFLSLGNVHPRGFPIYH